MASTNIASRPSALLSRLEAALYLGVTSSALAAWSCHKRYDLPFVKMGRLVKYRQEDLDEFIKRRTVGGETLH